VVFIASYRLYPWEVLRTSIQSNRCPCISPSAAHTHDEEIVRYLKIQLTHSLYTSGFISLQDVVAPFKSVAVAVVKVEA